MFKNLFLSLLLLFSLIIGANNMSIAKDNSWDKVFQKSDKKCINSPS